MSCAGRNPTAECVHLLVHTVGDCFCFFLSARDKICTGHVAGRIKLAEVVGEKRERLHEVNRNIYCSPLPMSYKSHAPVVTGVTNPSAAPVDTDHRMFGLVSSGPLPCK